MNAIGAILAVRLFITRSFVFSREADDWIRKNAARYGKRAARATSITLTGLCLVAEEPERPDDNSGDDNSDSRSPMENGDFSMPQFQKWFNRGYWISYENGTGCQPLYPGLATERLIYRCPDK